MTFIPGITPPADARDAAYVAFRGGEILVGADGGVLIGAAVLGDACAGARFVGTLDGRACFALPIADAPRGCAFSNIRAAFMSLDAARIALVSTASQIATWDDTHRFCGRCAAPLVAKTDERAKWCEACRIHFYPRISPAVIVLVHDGTRALLTHKNPMPFHALVAGFVEAGETFEEAVAREVREETGVAVDELRYAGSQPWPFPHQIMVGFFARYAGGAVDVARDEIDDAAWFDASAMPPLPPRISIARKMIDTWLAEIASRAAR
jgi:NAD+ diphosphatase